MLKKLNLVLRSPALRLTFKTAIFAGLLYLSITGSWLLVIAYLVSASYFYFKPFFDAKRQMGSFFVFLIASLLMIGQMASISASLSLVAAIILSVVFFFFLGAKNLFFTNQNSIFEFINNFLFFLVFMVFFIADKSDWFFIKYLIALAAIFLIFREFIFLQESQIKITGPTQPIVVKNNLFSASFSVLISQFILAASYLPIGFLNASALCLTAVLCLKDLTINYFHGNLTRTVILKNASLAMIFSLLIFAASKWQP